MSVSIVHTCIYQELIAQGIKDPEIGKKSRICEHGIKRYLCANCKCNCRKQIPLREATLRVKNGEAKWVVTKRTRLPGVELCRLCHGDPEMKKCANCGGCGTQIGTDLYEEYANDISLVSRASVDKTEKKYRPALAMKTPRVATVEEEHIERAYVDGMPESIERIEEYGRLILEARMFVGPKRNNIPGIVPEPEDDRDKGTGRKYDWGRAPFTNCQLIWK